MTDCLAASSIADAKSSALSNYMIPVSDTVFAMSEDMVVAALYMAISRLPRDQWPTMKVRDRATWTRTLNLVIHSISSYGFKRVDEYCSWLVDGSYQESINGVFDATCFDHSQRGYDVLFGSRYFDLDRVQC
ncbi:hypothetical protein [Haloglycomyces albus]|uniref:hypothetical protein n=1 Tax=Haloglycomyces albus TaxID=526067 RepID=UPI00046D7DB4|nr:hypothetical protein [Haloglycomyces albus]